MTDTKNPAVAAPPDWRGLCEELVEFVARLTKHYYEPAELLIRARIALARPEPEVVGPSDEELDELFTEIDGGGEVLSWRPFARTVLARWGRPAPAPAGEVGELVADLRNIVAGYKNCHKTDHIWSLSGAGVNARLTVTLLTRAADLLERQAAPVPVAVSERLPGAEDCDVDGMFWWGRGGKWALLNMRAAQAMGYTHWLPARALPLPSGEAQP